MRLFKKDLKEQEDMQDDRQIRMEDRVQYRQIAALILNVYLNKGTNEKDAINLAIKTANDLYARFKREGK